MDLNELEVFCRVAEAGSVTGGASRLGLPKSTVSRGISRLEDALGVRLFQRSTRQLVLTQAGTMLYERAAPHLRGLHEAASTISDQREQPSGLLRVTAPSDFGASFGAALITRFAAQCPAVHVEMVLTNRVVDLIAEGVDVALRAGALPDSSLVARKLGESPLILVAAPAYLSRRGVPESLADLSRHDCVLFRPRDGKARWVLTGPRPAQEEAAVTVTGRVAGDDFSFVRGAVLAGGGIGLIPWGAVAQDVAEGRLVHLLPQYSMMAGNFYLVYPSSKHLPPKVAAFRDFMIDGFASQPWGQPLGSYSHVHS